MKSKTVGMTGESATPGVPNCGNVLSLIIEANFNA